MRATCVDFSSGLESGNAESMCLHSCMLVCCLVLNPCMPILAQLRLALLQAKL